ncbi:hypothetical protein GIB67_037614 [Kingdonia uniflora]|uniref:Uncharacterized protein n=1 Tax=Kingdonia uniflora TaxID=39325 RepID=A0A7J7LSE9_9MAGN|nr:hypothetical protein GIB67_037614 [Kingdonia uniflora]
MASIFGCAKADEADLVGHLSLIIGVGDEEDTVAELIEWPRLKGSRVEYPTGSSRFREFCKAKSSIDRIWGHAFAYRGNFFRTCSVCHGGDYLHLLPDLAKEKKCRHLGDEVSLEYVHGVMKDSRTDGFCCYLAQFDYGLTLPLSNLAKSVMNLIGASSGNEKRITVNNFLEYYAMKYVTATNGINCKVSRKESFIDIVAREGTELEAALKELEISRFKRLARLNEILDGPVDMATVISTVVRNMAKRKAVKRGAGPRSVSSFARALKEVQLGSQGRSMELEKKISQLEGEKNQLEEKLTRERVDFQLERKKEKEAAALKLKQLRVESEAEAERLLRYTKAEIAAFSEGNYGEMEIMDEEEVEEREGGLNTAEKTDVDNQETINKALNQLISKLVQLKEKATSGSRHEAELAEYRIRALNEKIFDMKCNIHTLNELLLKIENNLDTARTNLIVSKADLEKLSSSIVDKD